MNRGGESEVFIRLITPPIPLHMQWGPTSKRASPSDKEERTLGGWNELSGTTKDSSWGCCSLHLWHSGSSSVIASCSPTTGEPCKPYVLRAPELLLLKHEWTTQNCQTFEASCQHESKKLRNTEKQTHKEAMIIQHREEQRDSRSYFIHEARNIKHETSTKYSENQNKKGLLEI